MQSEIVFTGLTMSMLTAQESINSLWYELLYVHNAATILRMLTESHVQNSALFAETHIFLNSN